MPHSSAKASSHQPRPVSIVYPHARLLPARTRAFIDWMKQELKALKT